MAKSRRNNGGCTRGRFKRKKMGKGYSTLRKMPVVPRPKTDDAEATKADATKADSTKADSTKV